MAKPIAQLIQHHAGLTETRLTMAEHDALKEDEALRIRTNKNLRWLTVELETPGFRPSLHAVLYRKDSDLSPSPNYCFCLIGHNGLVDALDDESGDLDDTLNRVVARLRAQ